MSRGQFPIAKNIKQYRNKIGITQDQLASLSGVGYNVLIKLESGATENPTIETVVKIAKGLKISIDDLLVPEKNQNILVCTTCKKEYSPSKAISQCTCGGILTLIHNSSFPIDEIRKRKQTMWRYREALPIMQDKYIISFDESITPLTKIMLGRHEVFVKQDHLFSSGSYKDRGASVLVSKALELGVNRVSEDSLMQDSSGSASNAVVSYCAHANITCDLYTPMEIDLDKLTQMKFFGAKIHTIKQKDKHNLQVAQSEYYANHSWNPYFLHGTKTFAFEICEQLGWKSPDTIILPAGNGTLLLGTYIGFLELLNAGVVSKMPKIIGIQSVQCAPLYFAYKKNLSEISSIDKKFTLAQGLAIEKPIRGKETLDAVRSTNGQFIVVTDHEIKAALAEMLRIGFYIEPTSAATIAGVKKYVAEAKPDEIIVSAFTGNGLGSIQKIAKLLNA